LPRPAAGSSGPSVLNFVVEFDSGKLLDTEFFERERWLVADEGIGRLTLAVEKESDASEVVYRAITKNKKLLFPEGSEGCFLLCCENMISFA